MKKLIAGVCFLALFAACQPVGNDNMANANKTPETKAVAPPSEADMIAKEKAAWDAFRRKDADAFKKLLAPEYIEIHDGGVRDIAAVVSDMKDVEISDITFADWKMRTIDKDLVLLTYTADAKGTFKGQPFPPGLARIGTAYINRNGEWLGIYFHETRASTAPPPPPAKKPAASPAASPATSPAKVETSEDVIANDKLVWELFRTRNFDAFSTLLAPEFTEIEPSGLYDKAGTVKAVSEMSSEMDASQHELSDWKAVKFHDAAALVTYTLTMKHPKPQKEYHATIWAKRDGKWLAFHHQGTPAAPAPGASPSPTKNASPSPTKKP